MEIDFLNFLNEDPGNWRKALHFFMDEDPDNKDRALSVKLLLDDLLEKKFIQVPSENEPYGELKDMTLSAYHAKHSNFRCFNYFKWKNIFGRAKKSG